MNTIAFIGFRGSGKTTLGKWLSEKLDLPFVDTDEKILSHLGYESVKEAWDEIGEEGWREAELRLIPDLLEQGGVVSLGGGAPMIPLVSKALANCSVVFNLTASEEDTLNRIEKGTDRPTLSEVDAEVRAQRLPAYAMIATCPVDTSGEISDCKDKILDFLANGHQLPSCN
jgi:shikimate kinase